MNEEIKEILDYLNEFINEDRLEQINLNRWFIISLLDYITNLQEENKRLSKQHLATVDKLIETQQRIDKAIEYIKENEFYLDYKTGACVKGVIPLLNILRGDKE